MRPRILFISAYLTLGAATTLGLAWASAAWQNVFPLSAQEGVVDNGSTLWMTTRFKPFGGERVLWRATGGFPPGDTSPAATEKRRQWDGLVEFHRQSPRIRTDDRSWWGRASRSTLDQITEQNHLVIEDARGWPLPAFWCTFRLDGKSFGSARITAIEGGIPLEDSRQSNEFNARVLPYRAIFLGLLVDTLLFAAFWAAITLVPIALFRHILASRRRARGQCPACAYDLSNLAEESPCCPECGWGTRSAQPSSRSSG